MSRLFTRRVCFLTIMFHCGQCRFLNFGNKNNSFLNNCIESIMSRYYEPGYTVLMVDEEQTKVSYPVIYFNSSKEIKIFDYCFPKMYIINSKNNELRKVFHALRNMKIFNSRAYFIIISEQYRDIFQKLAHRFVYNVVLIDTKEENVVTYDPYLYENVLSDGVEPTVLGKCSFDNVFNKTFPLLWRNTTVKAAYREHFPYLYHEEGRLTGENYELSKMLEEKLKFKLNLQQPYLNSTDINGSFGSFLC